MTMALSNNGDSRELEVLTITDLRVDHRYQRELDQRLVERILKDWDIVAADAISVSRREDGSLWIINGQHRTAAAALAGETEILAFVYEGLTVAQEADKRLKANNMRLDKPLERFHAQLTQGNPTSLRINEILGEFGTQINRTANSSTGVNCVSACERLFTESEELFVRTLRAIQEAHEKIAGPYASVSVLSGVFWFLKVHQGEYQWRSFVERMGQAGHDDLMRRARSHKSVAGGADWLNYYRALVEMYNHRRPEHTRLEVLTKYSVTLDSRGPRNR